MNERVALAHAIEYMRLNHPESIGLPDNAIMIARIKTLWVLGENLSLKECKTFVESAFALNGHGEILDDAVDNSEGEYRAYQAGYAFACGYRD
ncbi:MAG: hypothetical protein A2W25_11685 [candidate division Zixibacteria bacterium RBG_16_53_22]|nr:MAG: hypothetical protein A2W25_11685 [candidate division Zixibacteria bacterium RBG_16_53_22]